MRKIERSERIDLSSGLELQLRVSEVDGKRKRDRAMAVHNCSMQMNDSLCLCSNYLNITQDDVL